MKLSRSIAVGWMGIAFLLVVISGRGGDATILGGLLWLVWTAPVGLIWQFLLYERVVRILGTAASYWLGVGLVLIGAYLFWFYIIPSLFRWAGRRSTVSPSKNA